MWLRVREPILGTVGWLINGDQPGAMQRPDGNSDVGGSTDARW
jgi:hypothetical protein